MSQGVNMPFDATGIDPAVGGSLPVFRDGWKRLIITDSKQAAISGNKGGRLVLSVKCIGDPDNVDVGKEHMIGLNMWHNVPDTRARAEGEMSAIMHVVGKLRIQNTAELFNIPFWAKAVTSTSSPTPEYPNPQPQTNWRAYRDDAGNEPKAAGAGGGAPANQPPAFQQPAQVQQQPMQQQPQNPNWAPQGAAPAQQPAQNGGWAPPAEQQQQPPAQQNGGGWPAQQPQQQPPQGQPQNAGWNPGGGAAPAGGGNPPWG